jgi:putative nucleotidyltransferase with HDIG domain
MLIKGKFLLILSVMLYIASPINLYSAEDVSQVLYNEGIRKYILKDYTGAINDFQNAYSIKNDDNKIRKMYINALIKQGNIEFEKNKFTAAGEYFSKALSLSGRDDDLKNKLMIIQQEINRKKGEPGKKYEMTPREILEAENSERTGAKKTPAENIEKVQLPFDIEKFIREQNAENNVMLKKIIESHKSERELFYNNMKLIADAQNEDRKFFSRSLIYVLGGSILMIFIVVGLLIFFSRRHRNALTSVFGIDFNASLPAIESKRQALIEFTKGMDETKYITHENYSEIVRAKRLGELYTEFKKGDVSWETIQEYISELNHELKSEIMNIVEKKINSGDTAGLDNAFQILLSLVTAGDAEISAKSKQMVESAAGYIGDSSGSEFFDEGSEDVSGPLSMGSLLQLAMMADAKTGNAGHSTGVANIAYQIAERLKDPEIDPVLAKKVGLVHDIGYIEIDENLFRKNSELSQEEFSIVKKHTERGIKLIEHANPPQIFHDGINFHHERLDGSGYPNGLKGDEIPVIARILAVADFFNAVTSPRPYREALDPDSCLVMMKKLAGNHFDEKILNILSEIYSVQPDENNNV